MGTPEQIKRLPEKYTKDFKEGEIFFFEGEQGEEMFIIQSGSVEYLKKFKISIKRLQLLNQGIFSEKCLSF